MSVKSLVKAWNDFFFKPASPLPIAVFRIFFALLVIADLLLLSPDWLAWFGEDAWVSMATVHKLEPGVRINLFMLMPPGNLWPEVLFCVFLAFGIFLLAGFMTRASSIAVFICLASIQQRNPYIIHPGDTFMRVAAFFLMFAPAGAALSIDRLIRVRRGKEGPEIAPRSPWAQRMIQFELALAYLIACWWKSMGPARLSIMSGIWTSSGVSPCRLFFNKWQQYGSRAGSPWPLNLRSVFSFGLKN